jgi:hypothetical protein
MLLAETLLDQLYPGLHIDLTHPFGMTCPGLPRCPCPLKRPLTIGEIYAGWEVGDPNKYTTRCVACSREFVPRFTVQCDKVLRRIQDIPQKEPLNIQYRTGTWNKPSPSRQSGEQLASPGSRKAAPGSPDSSGGVTITSRETKSLIDGSDRPGLRTESTDSVGSFGKEEMPSQSVPVEDEMPWIGSEGPGTPLWCELLSPWTLRKEMFTMLFTEGIEFLMSNEFRVAKPQQSQSQQQHAVLFWNAIICARLYGLPYTFLLASADEIAKAFPPRQRDR